MALVVTDDLKAAAVSHAGSVPVARLDVFPVSGVASEAKGLRRKIYDGYYPLAESGVTILDEGDFLTHGNWDVTNDFDDTGGNAEYTWSANQTSTLQQVAGDRDSVGENATEYTLLYTVAVTTAPDGDFALTLENFAGQSTPLPYTAGAHTVIFTSTANATVQPFTIQATDTTATEGQFAIDNISCQAAEDTLWQDHAKLLAYNWNQVPPLGISPQQLSDNQTWSMKWEGSFKCTRPAGVTGGITYDFGYVSTGYVVFQVDGTTRTSGASPHSISEIDFNPLIGSGEPWIPITIWYSRSSGSAKKVVGERFVFFWKDNIDDEWKVLGSDVTCPPDGRYTNLVGTPVEALGIDPQYANSDHYTLIIHKVGSLYHFHTSTDKSTEYPLVPGQDTRSTPYNITGNLIGILWSDTIDDGDTVKIDVIRKEEIPWSIPVSDMTVDMARDGASTLKISVPVTAVAFDEANVDRTNFSTYDLDTDSFGVLRQNRLVKAHFGYMVDGSPEYVQRFTGLIQDIEPSHTVGESGTPDISLDVTCIDPRVLGVNAPVTKIEDMMLGAIPNDLSYDIGQRYQESTGALGGDGALRPAAWDGWNLADVVRVALYGTGFTAEQLWAKDSNGNFLIDDREVYLEHTPAYPYSILSELGADREVYTTEQQVAEPGNSSFWWAYKQVGFAGLTIGNIFEELEDRGRTTTVEHWTEFAGVKDMPYLYIFGLDAAPWPAVRELCSTYGLNLGVNQEGNVYMRYPNNPELFSASTTIGSNILAESDFATHANWDTTNDFDDTGGSARYLWSANQSSILQQTAANRLATGEGGVVYTLTYTISGTTYPDGDFSLALTNFASSDVSLPYTTGTHSVSFVSFSTAESVNFTITATDTTATKGEFTIDDISCGTSDELRSISYGTGWSVADEPEAISNIQASTSTTGAEFVITFVGVGIDLIFTRTQADSKVIVSVDGTIVDGVSELDTTTEDKGHTDWLDNVNSPDVDVTLTLSSLPDGVSNWFFKNGVYAPEGKNPTIYTICDNLTYGMHTVTVQQSSGAVYFEGMRIITTSVEQPQHEFDAATNLLGVDLNATLAGAANDVIIAGNMRGAIGDYIFSRAVDMASIGDEDSPNYIGIRKPLYIADPRIVNQERADFLAQHIIFRYRRGERNPVVQSPGLPWLEPDDPVTIRDMHEVSDGSFIPTIGLYAPGDITQTQRLVGIQPVPFQHYWTNKVSDTFSVDNGVPKYLSTITTTALPPLPAYEPIPEPDQNESTLAVTDINITYDGVSYNPFISDDSGEFVNIEFNLNWHARLLNVSIVTAQATITLPGGDTMPRGTLVNVLLARTGFVPAGQYTLQWDGWIEGEDGGMFAPDGNYSVRIETERYSTGAAFVCRAESGVTGLVGGSKRYIVIAQDRDAVYGVDPFSVVYTPSGDPSSPPVLYDLETNDGLGLKIDVTLAAPAQVVIPIKVRFTNSTTIPASDPAGAFFVEDWVIYLRGDQTPILEPGTYTFYFNPQTHVVKEKRRVLPFGASATAEAHIEYLIKHLERTGTTEQLAAWFVGWHFNFFKGILCTDKAGTTTNVQPSNPSWNHFNWGGPRSSSYTEVERDDAFVTWVFLDVKDAV